MNNTMRGIAERVLGVGLEDFFDGQSSTVHVLGQTLVLSQHNLQSALHQAIMIAGVVFIWFQIIVPELEATTASQMTLTLFSGYSVVVFVNASLSLRNGVASGKRAAM